MKNWPISLCFLLLALTPLAATAQPFNPLPATAQSPRAGTSGSELIPSPAVGWTFSDGGNGRYYQAVLAPAGVTWDEAHAWAVARGGQLASIGSAKANDFIYQLVRDRRYWSTIVSDGGRLAYGGPWLGAQRLASGSEATPGWVWADREQPFTFTNWAPNQAGNNPGLDFRLHYYSEHHGLFSKTWSQRPGEQRQRGFVVEYLSASFAPAGTQLETLLADPVVAWIESSGSPVRYFQAVSAPRAIFWSEAQAIAAAHGGHLVTITSAAQNEFIFQLVNDDRFWTVYRNNSNGPFLGGYKAPNPTGGTRWIWAGSQQPFGFVNWGPGQPDSSSTSTETRLHYYVAGGGGTRQPTWNDQPESANQFGFVIEYGGQAVEVPLGSEPGAILDPIPGELKLEAGTVVRWFSTDGGNNHWYQAVSASRGVKWSEAAAWAAARGGYLVTISSAAENNFVFRLVDQAKFWANDQRAGAHGPWLGGVKSPGARAPEDGWSWQNGGNFYAFTQWAGGQPNNSEQDDRVQFYSSEKGQRSSGWNDAPGEKTGAAGKGFVVEFDHAPVLLELFP